MKNKIIKSLSSMCTFCMVLGIFFTSVPSLIFFGEPAYPTDK